MEIDGLFAEVEKQPIYRREKTKAVFSLLTYTTVSYFKHPHLFFCQRTRRKNRQER